jgi:riboflavin kinase / FMN adenylyltransferase
MAVHAMEVLNGIESLTDETPCVAALGVFDGVHIGHRHVIGSAVELAQARGIDTMVVTFDKHPRTLVTGRRPGVLTSLRHKLQLIESLGVTRCVVLQFDERLAAMEASDFVKVVFRGAVSMVVGYDARFGRNRTGDVETLRHLGRAQGFDVTVISPVEVEGRIVSSTEIRKTIAAGRLDLAARMLGRQPSILGTVVTGVGRGKKLGFPTANLELDGEVAPPDGVYHTDAIVQERHWNSVTNIGKRPEFYEGAAGPKKVSIVETHILDYKGDLYGEEMEVVFLRKLRNEVSCHDELELMRLIAGDIEYVRSLAAERGTGSQGSRRITRP